MVRHIAASALATLFVALVPCHPAHADQSPATDLVVDRYEDGSHYQMKRPFRRSKVRAVTITEPAQAPMADEGDTRDCQRFVLSAALVKQYFARAEQVSAHAYMHGNDWSPCHVKGTLILADGRRADWGVQQLGSGYLVVQSRRYYFYCEDCRLTGLGLQPLVP